MARPPISKRQAVRRLAGLVGDLERHLESLGEEGVVELERPVRRPAVADASAAERLQAVARAVAGCRKCELHVERRQAVPGRGALQPEILFVGEGPGEEEDRQGVPFVGRAGQLLTRLIVRMGLTRDTVFISNIVKCRPPGNRKPLPEEMQACFPYLKAQIAALAPPVIVALGATALEALVPGADRISQARGNWLSFEGIPLMPTYHPSYLLRSPRAMWDVWHDMEKVLERLGRPVPPAKPS